LNFIKFKNPLFFKQKLIIIITKEDHFEEITEIRLIIKQKFLNLRLKRNYEEEMENLEELENKKKEDTNI